MTDLDDDEIIRLSILTQSDRKEDADELQRIKPLLSEIDLAMMLLASKLLAGQHIIVTSDSPQHIARSRTLAGRLGASASEETFENERGLPQVIFRPATIQ
jgi:hypothetical protein